MKRFRWQILIVLMALLAIGALLLGQQPVLQPLIQEIKPTTGGIYTEALVGSMGRLNPVLDFYNPVDRDVDHLIYSSLVRFDARGLPQYDLVESMGISQDGRIYNFSLRQNVNWSNGKPLTSEDVIFTINLLREESLPIPGDLRSLWESVEVEALDEHTLQFRLPEPYAPFIDYLSFGILPKNLLDQMDPQEVVDARYNLEPIGSGTYQFERLIIEDGKIAGLVLNAYQKYYGNRPFIDQVVFRYYPDSKSAFTAYKAGEVQGISRVTSDVLPEVLKEPNLNLYTGRLPHLTLIYLNLDNPELPFFQDAAVRRALLMGLNRQRIIDQLLNGQGIIADGPIFPGTWAYHEAIERVNYDPEGAITILKEAGYTIPAEGGNVRTKEDTRLQFELLCPDDPEHIALGEAIVRNWERLGVSVELKPVPYKELVDDYLEPRIYQAALVDLNLERSPDPDPYPFWHQAQITGGQNYSKWDDRQASEYLEQARVTVDIPERTRLYRNFQVRFANELPALPLFYPVYTYAVDAQVQGVTMGPLYDSSDRFANLTSWFLIARRALEEEAIPENATPAP